MVLMVPMRMPKRTRSGRTNVTAKAPIPYPTAHPPPQQHSSCANTWGASALPST